MRNLVFSSFLYRFFIFEINRDIKKDYLRDEFEGENEALFFFILSI